MKKQSEFSEHEKTCFVISPIGEPNSETREKADEFFETIITPAAQENGLEAIRADQISAPGIITTQIIQHILNDRMVVADLTDHNPNVFYELALRHAFRKPVVQLIRVPQKPPFDVRGFRTIEYGLELRSGMKARDEVTKQIERALSDKFRVDSPVTVAAQLEELSRGPTDINQLILTTLQGQFEILNNKISEMSGLICRPEDLRELIPPAIKDQTESVLQRYAEEIELLKSLRHAGVTGIFKRRETALKNFSHAIDEETREIIIIGSSLKGLLQKEDFLYIAEKLRFKADRGLVHVKFLLTHPIFADFRATQENRRTKEIGIDILKTLRELHTWNREYCHVRLYLGTPTCFAIKTSRKMLINPYPYISVGFDSPCLILEYSSEGGSDRPGYFFDEFNSRHFGAWDSNLSVHITDFNETIEHCSKMLDHYNSLAEDIFERGKSFH